MYPSTRVRCFSEISGPIITSGRCGSPYGTLARSVFRISTPSPWRERRAGRDGAARAGVEADPEAAEQRVVEVGVVEDDRGRLAAELEEHPLHRRRALLHDALADDGRARERDQVDLGREGELLADE